MADEVIDRLTVVIDSNIEDLVEGAEKGTKKVEDRLKKMGDTGEDAFDDVSKSAKGLGFQIGAVTAVVQSLIQGVLNLGTRAIQTMVGITQQAIGMRAEFEAAQQTFTNIFKDRETATAFLDNLKQTAQDLKVPFGEAQQFARSILPDTGSLDEFNNLLRLAAIGAKDANLPLRELIFSFNEAVAGDFVSIRDRLDIPRDVIQRIKDADNTTAALTEELGKLFEKRGISNLEAFDDTLNGVVGNLRTFADNLIFIAGEPGFEAVKETAQALLEVLKENQPEIERIAKALGQVAGSVIDLISSGALDAIETFDVEAFEDLTTALGQTVESARLLDEILPNIDLSDLTDDVTFLVGQLNQLLFKVAQSRAVASAEIARQQAEARVLADQLRETGERQGRGGIGGFLGRAVEAEPSFLGKPLKGLIGLFGDEEAREAARQAEIEGQKAFEQSLEDSQKAIAEFEQRQAELINSSNDVAASTEKDAAAIDAINESLAGNADALGKVGERQKELIRKFGVELINAQEKINADLEALQTDHAEKMIEIDQEEKERRGDINAKFDEQLADKREDILGRAREQLAELEQESDEALAQERRESQRDEVRETEDHLLALRRLREGHLENLEGIVARRDARALVDAQRQFRQRQQQESEDFEQGQQRERDDLNIRLAEIRQNERDRSNEIIQERERALGELLASNERGRQRELERLDADFAERRQKEQENFTERETLLNEALERQLEQMAISLANQGEVTEEGAANILGILAEHFGVGGKIDELMQEFRERVADLGSLELEVEASFKGRSSSSQQASSGGDGFLTSREFQHGTRGEMITSPTLALLGETAPEFLQVTPLSQMGQMERSMSGMQDREISLRVEMSGSAPPGIRSNERDQIAGVFVQALREAGLRAN